MTTQSHTKPTKALLITVLTVLLAGSTLCGITSQWKQRTIYQVITDRFWRTDGSTAPCNNIRTYCGGTWRGLINKLDYIKGMGFDAVWISPIPKNTPNGYHGYWQQDFTKLNEHFGTESDFANLVSALHARGMWIMLDVVANHVGFVPGNFGFQIINPFNKAEYYHDYCIISNSDFQNNQYRVQHCRLANLPDLNQDNSYVRSYLKNWIKNIVQKYKIDGVRIDTIPEVDKSFWAEYAKSAGVFTIGEAFDGRLGYVAQYQGPVNSMLNYPLYYTILDVFAYGKSMYELRTSLQNIKNAFKDHMALGNFVDNHDNPRFLNRNGNYKRLMNALAFIIFGEGIPIVYYGTEQGFNQPNDPYNRMPLWTTKLNTKSYLYQVIKTMVYYRKKNQIWNYVATERYVDNNFYAFSRNQVFVAMTNADIGQNRHTVTYIPYKNGETVCNILYKTDCLTINNNRLDVVLNSGEVKIFVPKSSL